MCWAAGKYWSELTGLVEHYRPYLVGEKVGLGIVHFEGSLACIGREFDRHIQTCPYCSPLFREYQSHAVVAMIMSGNRYERRFSDDHGNGRWAEAQVLRIFLEKCTHKHHYVLEPSNPFQDEHCGVDFWGHNLCRAELPIQFTTNYRLIAKKLNQSEQQRTVMVYLPVEKIKQVKRTGYATHQTAKLVEEFRNRVRTGLHGRHGLLTYKESMQMEALHMSGFGR